MSYMALDLEQFVAAWAFGVEALLDADELVFQGEDFVSLHIGKVCVSCTQSWLTGYGLTQFYSFCH